MPWWGIRAHEHMRKNLSITLGVFTNKTALVTVAQQKENTFVSLGSCWSQDSNVDGHIAQDYIIYAQQARICAISNQTAVFR